jgi:hypothetical protein
MPSNDTFEITFFLRAKSRAKGSAEERMPKVTRALATALYYQDLVRRGEVKNYRVIAEQARVSAARVGQKMQLVWLAPDIQQELLYLPATPAGRYPISEWALKPIAILLSWAEQRRKWAELKKQHRLL